MSFHRLQPSISCNDPFINWNLSLDAATVTYLLQATCLCQVWKVVQWLQHNNKVCENRKLKISPYSPFTVYFTNSTRLLVSATQIIKSYTVVHGLIQTTLCKVKDNLDNILIKFRDNLDNLEILSYAFVNCTLTPNKRKEHFYWKWFAPSTCTEYTLST